MSTTLDSPRGLGVVLAQRLGLAANKREGHDLAGPCIDCKSSDAFRIHQETGVAQCYSCGGKWSPFQMAERVLGDREQAKAVLVELGVFQPAPNGNGQAVATAPPPDPIRLIAQQKGVPPESLLAFGAKAITPFTVRLPAYGPDGKQCTHFDLSSVRGGKGLFASGKPAGLFSLTTQGSFACPRLARRGTWSRGRRTPPPWLDWGFWPAD